MRSCGNFGGRGAKVGKRRRKDPADLENCGVSRISEEKSNTESKIEFKLRDRLKIQGRYQLQEYIE